MARENKLDPSTANNDVGLYWYSKRVGTLPYSVGELATGLKAGTAGDVVYENELTRQIGITHAEAGEWVPIVYTKILATGVVTGTVATETTTAGNMIWTTTPAALIKTKVD